MLCKSVDIVKFSFLMVGVSYLLTTTALAQSPLSAPADDATQNIPNLEIAIDNNDGDELDIQKSEEDANPLVNGEANILLKTEGETETSAPEQEGTAPAPLFHQAEPSAEPSEDNMLRAYNNFVDETDKRAFNQPSGEDDDATFGDKIMNQVKEDLFSQMADIEKQTSLLTLELKREKIKNEIAAMKAARQKAIDEEKEKQRERERLQVEWEKEQERKLIEEQQRLKETEIKYEKLRQERVLKAYKESMLKSNQEWIDYNARIYNQLVREEKAHNELIAKQKEYFKSLVETTYKAKTAAQTAKEKYTTEIANLQTQVALLKSKLEAEMSASEEKKKQISANPFALADEDGPKQKIAEEYAIMEISGKGDTLVAKLINKNGGTFMVKPGTILNTGHVIEEITQTYITADRSGVKDYLYFSAGGILDKEPSKPIQSVAMEPEKAKEAPSAPARIPSLREGMFAE